MLFVSMLLPNEHSSNNSFCLSYALIFSQLNCLANARFSCGGASEKHNARCQCRHDLTHHLGFPRPVPGRQLQAVVGVRRRLPPTSQLPHHAASTLAEPKENDRRRIRFLTTNPSRRQIETPGPTPSLRKPVWSRL